MEIILWRHAEAEDGIPDLQRQLTEKGKRQARFMADWLVPRLPKDVRIIVSPAKRTRQTADALDMHYAVVDAIAPGCSVEQLLTAADWENGTGTVLVVGHQPTLGLATSFLIYGEQRPLNLKKGGICWISRQAENEGENVMRGLLTPGMLKLKNGD